MPSSEPFRLPIGDATLHGIVTLPAESGPRPTVVVCHGFKGFMEWGFFPALADLLAERGFTVVRFNFRGSGMAPGDERVTDLGAFHRATIGRDLEDVGAVLAATGERIAAGHVDRDRLGLFGHSRGGGVALLAAASESPGGRPRALVTWAAVASFDRLSDDEKAAWRRDGEVRVVNARTGQELAVGTEVLDELERDAEKLDLEAAARRRTAPWLIIHGAEDESVPAPEAETLARAARPTRELLMIAGGGHTFGAVHPFAGPTPQLIQAMNATQTWFRRHL